MFKNIFSCALVKFHSELIENFYQWPFWQDKSFPTIRNHFTIQIKTLQMIFKISKCTHKIFVYVWSSNSKWRRTSRPPLGGFKGVWYKIWIDSELNWLSYSHYCHFQKISHMNFFFTNFNFHFIFTFPVHLSKTKILAQRKVKSVDKWIN